MSCVEIEMLGMFQTNEMLNGIDGFFDAKSRLKSCRRGSVIANLEIIGNIIKE